MITHRLTRRLVLAPLALGCVSLAQAQPSPAPSPAALDSLIQHQMSEAGIVGLGAAVLVNGEVVYQRGFGHRNVERTLAFTPQTVMNVASIAKTVTGVAMMRAVHEGRLSLDEDINRYLPFRVVNPHIPDAKITLRHLATHTSGITDRWAVYRRTYHYGGDSPVPLGQFLRGYFTTGGRDYDPANFLAAAPGTQREYSNIGAALAGYIVERAVGMSLPAYTRQHIFRPLGMRSSGWRLSEMGGANHSTLFVSQNGHSIPIPLYGSTTYPDGGVRTSVADLTRFFRVMLNDGALDGVRVLDAKATAEMKRFQFTDANRPQNFPASDGNSGLFWRTKFGGRRVGHGGNDPGIQTEMLADLSGRVGVIMFVNTSVSGEDARAPGVILDALFRFGEARR